ncbi:MAG: type II toxin-antitoxin system VapC family toxin [Promethearchaeota archaeon]
MKVFIDTEIWVFAKKKPGLGRFAKKSEFNEVKEFHIKSKEFLKKQIGENEILITNHQLAEIYHVLGFRGLKLPLEAVLQYCTQLISSKFVRRYSISSEHLIESIKLSRQSGIHVWDYLCVIPLRGDADVLYSCDVHFKDPTFQSLGPKIINPLNKWFKY